MHCDADFRPQVRKSPVSRAFFAFRFSRNWADTRSLLSTIWLIGLHYLSFFVTIEHFYSDVALIIWRQTDRPIADNKQTCLHFAVVAVFAK